MANDPQKTTLVPSKENRAVAADKNKVTRRRNRGNGEVADWRNADPEYIITVISAITGKGGAVQFGLTKDGGSLVVRVIGDGEPYNEYVRPSEDVDLYLQGLAADFT